MNDDTTPTIVPVAQADVTPDKPPAKQIPAKIPDEDRAPLNELFMKLLAMQNAKAAFDAQIAQYKAQADLAQTRIGAIMQQGVEVEHRYNDLLAATKERLGIPAHWTIDTESGATAPPQSPQGPR